MLVDESTLVLQVKITCHAGDVVVKVSVLLCGQIVRLDTIDLALAHIGRTLGSGRLRTLLT